MSLTGDRLIDKPVVSFTNVFSNAACFAVCVGFTQFKKKWVSYEMMHANYTSLRIRKDKVTRSVKVGNLHRPPPPTSNMQIFRGEEQGDFRMQVWGGSNTRG